MQEKIRQMKLQSFDMKNHLKDSTLSIHLKDSTLSIHLNEFLIEMLDNKKARKLLLESLESTRKQLDYILNYKSSDERCSDECEYNCNDCDEKSEVNEFKFNDFSSNTVIEGLQEICNDNDLRIIRYEEYDNSDDGITYAIELKEV